MRVFAYVLLMINASMCALNVNIQQYGVAVFCLLIYVGILGEEFIRAIKEGAK